MSNLAVIEISGQNVVDSRLVAENLAIEHKSFIRLIRKYATQLQAFGQLGFEIATVTNSVGAINQLTFCYLNEEQATFVMTLSKNTERVVQCKLNLVKAFSDARKLVVSTQPQLPANYIEALKALVALEEAKVIADAERALLEEQNQQLAEAVDELFDYSSIVRIAKFNKVSEKLFKWQTLKAVSKKMELEIKRVPCPRFEYKNVYSHDVWRVCYPAMRLPETTTFIVKGV